MDKRYGFDGSQNATGVDAVRQMHGGPEDRMPGMAGQGMAMRKGMMGRGPQGPAEGMGGMMQICQNMTAAVARSAEMAGFATEEIRGLFQDWFGQIEAEVLDLVGKNSGQIDLSAIADQLSISEKSARHIVGVLFQKGLLDLGQVHVDATQSAQQPTESDEGAPGAEGTKADAG